MLSITHAQLKTLQSRTSAEFVRQMVAHVRDCYPQRAADQSGAEVAALVQEALREAQNHDIVLQDDIRRFVECCVTYGSRLSAREDTRWIGDILNRRDLDGTQKMDIIDSRELQRLRGQA